MREEFLGGRIEPREYQINIYNLAREFNTLVILPTGLGKTIIAAMVAEHILSKSHDKVMFLAPTRPLVNQHFETLKRFLSRPGVEISAFTGDVDNEDRLLKWVTSNLIISTPQVAMNDLRNGLYDISKFGLVVFDEAHRATGNYAYVEIAHQFLQVRKRLILGMTASPGSDREKLDSITGSLGIERVVIKNENDPDVRKYIGGIEMDVVKLEPPLYIKSLSTKLKSVLSKIIDNLISHEIIKRSNFSRSELAKKIGEVVERARSGDSKLYGVIPYISAAIRLDYLLEYIETQGLEVARDYLNEILSSQEKTLKKTASILWKIPEFEEFVHDLDSTLSQKPENPKMNVTLRICEDQIAQNPDSRVIIFTHFRKTSDLLTEYLSGHSSLLRPVRFVGQSSRGEDTGLNQKDQDLILHKFRENVFNVLVATSVAEEGLDVPSTDLVVFFEPVPSEIRSIQRRGRTGRTHSGKVKILVYNGTRDAAYYYSSIRKENRMRTNISKLPARVSGDEKRKSQIPGGNPSLDDFLS